MKLKQFLKPDWRKIVIFAILLFITYIGLYSVGLGTFSFSQLIFFIIIPFAFFNLPFSFPVFLLFWFVYQYLLSCLIVWIYDKFRKVKKK